MRKKVPSDLKSNIFQFKNLIKYQTDSIVSRVIVDTNNTKITLFAFDNGQSLSEHTTSFNAFVNIVEGNMAITISGEVFQVKDNQTIIMPAHAPHSLIANSKAKMLLVMYK
ncbi:MAG: cupin domain-containing protein [Candidatus Omnitrophica bacterium]|nr:cupin domain-containing protein [Candidatus Omnitrophota bacterium]MCF7878892.1 cupin domain-containing protein [Candidatus Omnitrophota bacterium]MCF7891681.1 cupin domain-containing protein [Candidatus Omnitrophota bacterium]MCF7895609.1 cupin domain-containing protein [Candidatus Omnitrophota bacterium]MCF7897302.1 cupin domain-containing protein [Candidatus Omnitrophota bacterium]